MKLKLHTLLAACAALLVGTALTFGASEGQPVGNKRNIFDVASDIVQEMLQRAVSQRMNIVWQVFDGHTKPSKELAGQPTIKTMIYYGIACPSESGGDQQDVLAGLHRSDEWFLQTDPLTAQGSHLIHGIRRDLVQLVMDNPGIRNSLIEIVAKSTIRATAEGTQKRKQFLLELAKSGQFYLSNLDLAKERAWHDECKTLTKTANAFDEANQGQSTADKTLYRFAHYAPGSYSPSAVVDPMRPWHAFLYRRIAFDGLSVEQLSEMLGTLQEKVYSAPD